MKSVENILNSVIERYELTPIFLWFLINFLLVGPSNHALPNTAMAKVALVEEIPAPDKVTWTSSAVVAPASVKLVNSAVLVSVMAAAPSTAVAAN